MEQKLKKLLDPTPGMGGIILVDNQKRQTLQQQVDKLERVIRQLITYLQATPALSQYTTEELLKLLDHKEVEDERNQDQDETDKTSKE